MPHPLVLDVNARGTPHLDLEGCSTLFEQSVKGKMACYYILGMFHQDYSIVHSSFDCQILAVNSSFRYGCPFRLLVWAQSLYFLSTVKDTTL